MTPVLMLTLVVAAYGLYVGGELIRVHFLPDEEKKSAPVEERKARLMRRAGKVKSVLLVLFVLVTISNLKS